MRTIKKLQPRSVRKTTNVERALELRTAGLHYSKIGEAMGKSRTQAYRLVKAGLEELQGTVKERASSVREIELRRLDALVVAHWNNRQDPRSAAVILQCQERRAKYLGLDAPAKQEVIYPQVEAQKELDTSKLTQEERLTLEQIMLKALPDEDIVVVKDITPQISELSDDPQSND